MNDQTIMRRIPANRLLIQPRVHLQWLWQSKVLCFEVSDPVAECFGKVWRRYQQAGCPSPVDFLERYPLTEEDPVFALFVGAVHARGRVPEFRVEIQPGTVVWRGETGGTLVHSDTD